MPLFSKFSGFAVEATDHVHGEEDGARTDEQPAVSERELAQTFQAMAVGRITPKDVIDRMHQDWAAYDQQLRGS